MGSVSSRTVSRTGSAPGNGSARPEQRGTAGVPATFFLCGRTIELNKEDPFARHPLFDLKQHTYNHVLLKSVCIEDPEEGV